MFGLKTREPRITTPPVLVDKKTLEEAWAQNALIDEIKAEKLARKEFENTKSICLECTHAFVYRYLPNPDNSLLDPLVVKCKVMAGMKFGQGKVGWPNRPNRYDALECQDDYWFRKCTSCSDFKPRA